jgi:hypothetical protein
MTKKNAANSSEKGRRDEPKLDSRYGEIGISAVAAALQYASGCKTEKAVKTAPNGDALQSPQIKWLADLAA